MDHRRTGLYIEVLPAPPVFAGFFLPGGLHRLEAEPTCSCTWWFRFARPIKDRISFLMNSKKSADEPRDAEQSPREIKTQGKHLIADFWNCDVELLNDEGRLRQLVELAAEAGGAEILALHSQRFEYQGVTAFAILAESHLSVHTWPEAGYVGADMYTCGSCDPKPAMDLLAEQLGSTRTSFRHLTRGIPDSESSIQLTDSE